MIATIVWTIVGFLSGSIPFSVIVGKLFSNADIRTVDDGNPGATNVYILCGWKAGLIALVLDISKALVPVGVASFKIGISGWGLVPVALSPVLGHAFSSFLLFRGGKAIATTFGIWTVLLFPAGPFVLMLFWLVVRIFQKKDAWAFVITMFCFGVFILCKYREIYLMVIWFGNLLILLWKHRKELQEPMLFKPSFSKVIGKRRTKPV